MSGLTTHPAKVVIPTINLVATLITMFMEPDTTRKPFRAVWNYPDKPCRGRGVDFRLGEFSIESNSEDFIEDTIALYYSSNIGMWPYFEFGNESDTAVHGGWPHRFNLGPHLEHMKEVISTHQSPMSSGLGIIDMELWRPILKTNYGRYAPYKEKIVDYMADKHPHLETHEHKSKADEIWSHSTRALMLLSLTVAKMTRPYAQWGYYGYPELVTAADNHELEWLWKTVTAYYPSIYIKNYTLPVREVEEDIKATIAEAYRVRALYGDPRHPIMAYVDVQNIPEDGQDEWLRLQLQVPVDMGADGIILWASSRHFSPDTNTRCLEMQQYIKDKVGPYIANMTRYMTSCSKQLCTGRGRCIRKTYARSIPHLITRGVRVRGDGGRERVDPLLYRKIYTGFKRDYQCQCYTGWYGKRCVEAATIRDEGGNS